MWIKTIKLQNFKSYAQAEFNFPEPENGQNIILIGAVNGHGKTTLLEAIYLCLYGEDATPHLKRAGIPADRKSYDAILKDALHHDAVLPVERYGQRSYTTMSVVMEIMHSKNHGLRVQRSWVYDSSRNRQSENDQVRMWRIDNENGHEAIKQEDFKNALNDHALPFSYAPFFFFDGEKIVNQAETAGTGLWLKEGLEGLCGISLLSNLNTDLQKYISDCLKGVSEQDKQELERKERELSIELQRLEILTREKSNLAEQKNELAAREDELQNLLGGGINAKSTEQLRGDIAQAKSEIEKAEAKIADALKATPLALLPTDMVKDLQIRLRQEYNRLSYEASKTQGENKIDDFMEAFTTSPRALEVVGPQTLKSDNMREAIKDAWNKLWYPLPANCAEHIIHNYLTQEAHTDVQRIIENRASPNIDLNEQCKKISACEAISEDLQTQLNRLAGSNNDELLAELKETSSKHKEVAVSLNGKATAHAQVELKFAAKTAELEALQKRIMDSEPNQIKARRAQKTQKMMETLSEQLINLKLNELSQAVTALNNTLAHDKRIAQIKIKTSGDFLLLGENGAVISSSLSAGQMQILIMALVSGLAQVTGYGAPYVIDTPLARLDDGHRQRLFKHWSNLKQQVILLSQDTEITPEVKNSLAKHVQKTYLVKAESLATGGALSNIIENSYFN